MDGVFGVDESTAEGVHGEGECLVDVLRDEHVLVSLHLVGQRVVLGDQETVGAGEGFDLLSQRTRRVCERHQLRLKLLISVVRACVCVCERGEGGRVGEGERDDREREMRGRERER